MTPAPGADSRWVVPHASPAPVTCLAAAVVPAGAASAGGAVPQGYVLSSDGKTARCWPAGSGPGEVDGGPRYGRLPEGLVLARLALVHLDHGADIVVASARPRFGHREERALLRWDRESGEPAGDPVLLRAPRVHPAFGNPLAVAATSAGPVAATGSAGGGVQLRDLVTGLPAGGPLGREYGTVLALAAGTLADGSPVIVSAFADSTVRRWDPVSGAEIGEPIRRCGHAVVLEFTRLPDGRRVVTVLSGQGSVHRRDLLTGEPLAPKIITGWEPGRIKVCMGLMAVVATDDGAVIATSTSLDRRSVRLWDLVSGEPRGELRSPQSAWILALAPARLPDGTPLLLAGDGHGSVHGFDARDGRPAGEPVQPHGTQAARVLPVTEPGGRLLLAVGGASTRLVDARTGEPAGGQWDIDSGAAYATTVVPLADGRIVSASAHAGGLALHDARSGAAFPPPHTPSTLWDVAAATLPDGRVVIGGAGHDWLVYRWDAATGQRIGEPLHGHRLSVKAIAVARQADGRPMFVTGCERGEVLRWDAATGEQIGPPLPGTRDGIDDLAVAGLPGGRQVLAGLGDGRLHRWDPVTGDPLGPPVHIARWATFTAIYVDKAGVPFGFVDIPDHDAPDGKHTERWRLDSAARAGPPLPATFRAVFDDAGVTRMVLAEPDGSLTVCPLPPIEADPGN